MERRGAIEHRLGDGQTAPPPSVPKRDVSPPISRIGRPPSRIRWEGGSTGRGTKRTATPQLHQHTGCHPAESRTGRAGVPPVPPMQEELRPNSVLAAYRCHPPLLPLDDNWRMALQGIPAPRIPLAFTPILPCPPPSHRKTWSGVKCDRSHSPSTSTPLQPQSQCHISHPGGSRVFFSAGSRFVLLRTCRTSKRRSLVCWGSCVQGPAPHSPASSNPCSLALRPLNPCPPSAPPISRLQPPAPISTYLNGTWSRAPPRSHPFPHYSASLSRALTQTCLSTIVSILKASIDKLHRCESPARRTALAEDFAKPTRAPPPRASPHPLRLRRSAKFPGSTHREAVLRAAAGRRR